MPQDHLTKCVVPQELLPSKEYAKQVAAVVDLICERLEGWEIETGQAIYACLSIAAGKIGYASKSSAELQGFMAELSAYLMASASGAFVQRGLDEERRKVEEATKAKGNGKKVE